MRILPKFLLPGIVGVTVYLVIHKLFPEKVESFDHDPTTAVRGGDNNVRMFTRIFRAIKRDRALKIALLAAFSTAGATVFHDEIGALLKNDAFKSVYSKDTDGNLKVVCHIIEKYELNSYTDQIKDIIISTNLSKEDKISLLKIKLDFIINGESGGKSRFLIMVILGLILTFTISGVGGFALILEALYRLFKEGKISQAVYLQLVKALSKRSISIDLDHLDLDS